MTKPTFEWERQQPLTELPVILIRTEQSAPSLKRLSRLQRAVCRLFNIPTSMTTKYSHWELEFMHQGRTPIREGSIVGFRDLDGQLLSANWRCVRKHREDRIVLKNMQAVDQLKISNNLVYLGGVRSE